MTKTEEQFRRRKLLEDELLEESLWNMGNAVLGEKVTRSRSLKNVDALNDILEYYHYKPVEPDKNDRELPDQLETMFRPKGIAFREVRLPAEKRWWKHAYGPYLGFLKEGNTPVALLPSGRGKYYWFDYASHRKIFLNDTTAQLLTDNGYCFYKPLPLRELTAKELLKFAASTITSRDVAVLVLFYLLATLTSMLIPTLTSFLMGEVLEVKELNLLLSTLLFSLCASVASALFTLYRSFIETGINARVEATLGNATMMRVLSLPASFFRDFSSGELASRINNVTTLAASLVQSLLTTVLTSLFSLLFLVQIARYAPGLVLPALAITLITFLISLAMNYVLQKRYLRIMDLAARENGMKIAAINGMQKIKTAGAEKRVFAQWGNLFARRAAITYKPIFTPVLTISVTMLGQVLIYYCAVHAGVSVSDYYAFNVAFANVSAAFAAAISVTDVASQISPALKLAKPILDAVPEVTENRKTVSHLSGAIEMDNISFRYLEGQKMILDGLGLTIQPGEYVAIVGPTGCGKSTLVRLLLGFEKPIKGSIYYDRQDMNTLDLKSLRRQIGTVLQDTRLFLGSIYDNITITAPWLTRTEAMEVAKLAGLEQDIQAMPMGLNTLITEDGGISGGQRQRLCIARAIAPNPAILVFDEATSALDNITQKQISDALDSLHCTRIVIAHRLSTIKHCDRIIYLDHGKITEQGTFEELMALQGDFAELVKRQVISNQNL